MKKFFAVSFFFLIVCCASPKASADTFTLVSGSGVTTADGFTVGPLSALLNSQGITAYCIDFDNRVEFGQSWDVQVRTFGELSGAALAQYQQAAWLSTQFAVNPTSSWSDIQSAAWRLFSNDPTLVTAGSDFWLAQAQSQNFSGFDFSAFRILTPTGQDGQEMLTTVPEPATLILLGTGLSAVAVGARRRRRRARV